MPGLLRARSKSRSLLVILPCGAVAFALPFLFREGALKPAAPAIFLLVIILVAHFSGRLASLLVAILGGLVFAGFLFRPYGRFAVYNAADRVVLLLIRRVRPRRGLPFQDPGKTESPRAVGARHAEPCLKKRLACGARIQGLPLRDAFPIARRPPSKPTASTHPG